MNSTLRVVRATTRSAPRLSRPSAATPPRRFASTKTASPPSPEFERLLRSLSPNMANEDLAKRVAALYLLSGKGNEVEQLEKRLKAILQGPLSKEVSSRIKHYLAQPPKELMAKGMFHRFTLYFGARIDRMVRL